MRSLVLSFSITSGHQYLLPNANLGIGGSGNDRTLRIFAFADAGNVWAEAERTTWESLRASYGFGLSWISPVGPLKLSWGKPFQVQRNDRIQRFQFQIGTAF